MTDVACPRCGGPLEAPESGSTIPVVCPGCDAILELSGGNGGAETILIPDAQVAGSGEPVGGTMLLKAEADSGPPVTVKVKGFLSQEGSPPGDADYRLRSGTTVVGRVQGAIRLADVAVSSQHFQVEERGSEFFLRDLGSSNGTFLNGHRVRSAKLQSGDRITAGGTTFTFSVRQIIPM